MTLKELNFDLIKHWEEFSRLAATAVDNYYLLKNCSSTVEEACNIPTTIFNSTTSTFLSECDELFQNFKALSASKPIARNDRMIKKMFQTAELLTMTTVLLPAPAGSMPTSVSTWECWEVGNLVSRNEETQGGSVVVKLSQFTAQFEARIRLHAKPVPVCCLLISDSQTFVT